MDSQIKILGALTSGLIMLITTHADAQVTFADGYWSSSFIGCPTGDVGMGDVCDGLRAVSAEYVCGADPALHSQITPAANFAAGAGGNGFALYYEGDVRNAFSTGLSLGMDPPQPELWLRFYRQWPVGQTWGGLLEHKIVYFFTDDAVAVNINFPEGEDDIGLQPRNTMGSPDVYFRGNGWASLNAGSPVGDGTWHAFEFHFRLGTSGGDDGVIEMWIDGVNVMSANGLDFFDGGARAPTGWREVELPSNHNVSTLAGCAESRVDDIAVALPGYAGFVADAEGRPLIGRVDEVCVGAGCPPPADGGVAVMDGGAATSDGGGATAMDGGGATAMDGGGGASVDGGGGTGGEGCGCTVARDDSRAPLVWLATLAVVLGLRRRRHARFSRT